jgi:hypothetical protein
VATSVLTPGQIGSPIRGILCSQKNVTVIMGEVTGVDKNQKLLQQCRPREQALRQVPALSSTPDALQTAE